MVHTFEVFCQFQAGFSAFFCCALCFVPILFPKLSPVLRCFKAHTLFTFLVCMIQTEVPESKFLGDATLFLFNISLVATLYEMAEHRRPSSIHCIYLIMEANFVGFIFVSFFNPSTDHGKFISKITVPICTTIQGYLFQKDFMYVSLMSNGILILWCLGCIPEEKPKELDLICIMGNFANLLVECKYLWRKIVMAEFQRNQRPIENVRNEPSSLTSGAAAEMSSMDEVSSNVSASSSRETHSIETSMSQYIGETSSQVSSTPSRFEYSRNSNATLSMTPLDITFIDSTAPFKQVIRTTSDSITISRSPFFETQLPSFIFQLKNQQKLHYGKRLRLHNEVVLYE